MIKIAQVTTAVLLVRASLRITSRCYFSTVEPHVFALGILSGINAEVRNAVPETYIALF